MVDPWRAHNGSWLWKFVLITRSRRYQRELLKKVLSVSSKHLITFFFKLTSNQIAKLAKTHSEPVDITPYVGDNTQLEFQPIKTW